MTLSVLVIAAHSDDEALGCGGTLALHASRGDPTAALFLTDGVGARGVPSGEEPRRRRAAAQAAMACLGIARTIHLDLPDNEMDRLPLLEIVRSVETVIAEATPDIVYTHHAGDLNVDHRLTHQAVVTALRPQPGRPAPTILSFEVASSTEWQSPLPHFAFVPNWFQDITATFDKKCAALRCYEDEMRPWPHSRSVEAVSHLARWRGATVGVDAAEAFMLVRRIAL